MSSFWVFIWSVERRDVCTIVGCELRWGKKPCKRRVLHPCLPYSIPAILAPANLENDLAFQACDLRWSASQTRRGARNP